MKMNQATGSKLKVLLSTFKLLTSIKNLVPLKNN